MMTQTQPILTTYHSWFFCSGHDSGSIQQAIDGLPSMLVIDLEEFTPAEFKLSSCQRFHKAVTDCHKQGIQCAIRIDQITNGGAEQLALIAHTHPDAVFLPQVDSLEKLQVLRQRMNELGLANTAIVPTIESPTGLQCLHDILAKNPTENLGIGAALLGTGDLSSELGIATHPQRMQLLQAERTEFLSICQKHKVTAIDGPWPSKSNDVALQKELDQDTHFSRNAGFTSRCAISLLQVEKWQTAHSSATNASLNSPLSIEEHSL